MPDLPQIAEKLSALTVLEAAELSRLLEARWGVSASAPVAQVQTVLPPVVEAEQEEFTVILTGLSHPDKKIVVIKEVRTATGLGLKEAKEFTEAAGPTKVLKENLTKVEAAALKTRMEEAGAVVVIQ